MSEFTPGQIVWVHQNEGKRKAVVIKSFPSYPTMRQPGYWVDVVMEDMKGVEEVPSYMLETVTQELQV